MLPPFISDAKDKHPTFIFSVIRSRMLPPFISDAKDNHPTFILSVIRSRMLPSFISAVKDKHPTFILASYGAECYRHSFPTLKTKQDICVYSVYTSENQSVYTGSKNGLSKRAYFAHSHSQTAAKYRMNFTLHLISNSQSIVTIAQMGPGY